MWINGRFFSGTAAFAIRCMSSGRTLPVPVISATHNATSCASSALLALPADAGTGPFSLTVKTSSGTSTAAVLGAPAVDWASAYIAAQSVHRRCHSAVYGRNLATLLHPTVELMAVDGELEQPRDDDGAAPSATTATITDLTETRACFESPSSLVAGTHSVKLCGFIGGTASGSAPQRRLCSDGRATTQVVENPQPSKQLVINASQPPYSLNSSGRIDVTSGLRQAILDATRNGTQPRGVVVLGSGTFLLSPYTHPSPLLDRCAICQLGSAFQVDLRGAGMEATKLLVGPGTDAAFSAALVGLQNLTLGDTQMPDAGDFSVNGTSIRALWTMTKLAVIPPQAETPANSTGMQEMAAFAGTDIAFRSVRFVSHRVSAGLSLRYLKRAVIEDCEFVGGNIALWGPLADVRVEGNRGRMSCGDGTGLGCGGFIDALGWGGAGHATDFVITGNTVQHLHPLESSRFPGRFFVGQNYLLRRMYLADNVNKQAGPGALSDQNKGEQVLLEVGDTDITSRVLSVNGSSLTLEATADGSTSDVLTALATRAGKHFDGSTIAVAWSYFKGLGVVSIQSGVGAGQWRTIIGIDGGMLELDRPFAVAPNVDSGLAICGSSVHDIIVTRNEFIGSFAKNHTIQEPHVATAALFIWANTFRYTAIANTARWIRASLDLFAVLNGSVTDVLIKDTHSVNTRYGVQLNVPLRPGISGLVVRNLSIDGTTFECGLCASSSSTGGSSSTSNGTAGVGVILELMHVASAANGVELSPGRTTGDRGLTEATLRNCTINGNGSGGGVGLWHNTTNFCGWQVTDLELDGFEETMGGSQPLPARCSTKCNADAHSCNVSCSAGQARAA